MIRKYAIITIILMVLAQLAIGQQAQDRLYYIDKYIKIAQDEMERTGVPASIKLAQAILESNGGKSILSRKANNHFGIKCGGDWDARSFYRFDDEKDNKGNPIESCFRAYKNPESSFVAHSEFLRNNQRYDFLFELDHTDYYGWAHGLKRAGYATNPKYPTLLVNIIENYELDKYDVLFDPASGPMIASTDEAAVMEEIFRQEREELEVAKNKVKISKLNDISVVRATADDTPEIISIKTNVPLKRIFKYNAALVEPGQALPANATVFLQPKRNSYRGKKKFHKVSEGESVAEISQKYGIKLAKLLKRNRLESNQEPQAGAILKLKGKRINKHLTIPTLEVYTSGQERKIDEEEVKSTEKYATSISDFEAPPSLNREREEANKIKKIGQKNTNSSIESSDINTTISTTQNTTVGAVQRHKEIESTGVYRAPVVGSSSNVINNTNPAVTNNGVVNVPSTSVPSGSVSTPSYPSTSTTIPNTQTTTTVPSTSTYSTAQSTTVLSTNTYSDTQTTTVPSTSTYSNTQSTTVPSTDTYSDTQTTTVPSTSTYSNTQSTIVPSTSTNSDLQTANTPNSSVSSNAPTANVLTTVVSTPQAAQTKYHVVAKGETLYRLSKQYGKSVDFIKQANGLNSNTISIGQKLIVN